MTEATNDMFSGGSGAPDDKKLLDFLNGSLPEAEKNQLEGAVPENPFLKDAVEGLETISNRADLHTVVHHLKQNLHQQLSLKKTHSKKRDARFGEWIYWAIVVVLLLVITGFLMLRFMLK